MGHRMKTMFFLNPDDPNLLWNRPDMGIHEDHHSIIGHQGNDFWNQLVEHDRVNSFRDNPAFQRRVWTRPRSNIIPQFF
jgi:hypothetical protein